MRAPPKSPPSIGQGFAFALGFIGLFSNFMLIFIAIFVYLAASSEAHFVAMRSMARGVPVSAAMMTQYATLTPSADVEDAVQTLLRTSQSEFPVVDDAGKPVGLLARADIIRALKERGPDARVADAMTTHGADASAIASRWKMRSSSCRRSRCRRWRWSMPSGRLVGPRHLGNHRRDDDGARGAAEGRDLRALGTDRADVSRPPVGRSRH